MRLRITMVLLPVLASCYVQARGAVEESTAPLNFAAAFPPNPVRLPQLLGDGAVLQRDAKIPVWGWGESGRTVTIEVAGQTTTASVGLQNLWATRIGPLKAGGPFELTAGDGNSTVTSHDVFAGDVWLCGGQSSMAQTLAGVADAEREVAAADVPGVHLFEVPRTTAFAPQNDFPPRAGWEHCTPETARRFSAIGYFFVRGIAEKYRVPVGIISATWVNTTIPVWMSEAACSQFGDYDWWQNQLRRTSTPQGRARLDDEERWRQWIPVLEKKSDGTSSNPPWYSPKLRLDREWKTMRLPHVWEGAGLPNFDGVVWFRKSVALPENWLGTTPTLNLAHIYDHGTIWFNGQSIGRTDDWATTVSIDVPPTLVKRGRNEIAVRVLDTELYGGIYGTTDSLSIECTSCDGGTSITLSGDWRYRVGLDLKTEKRPWQSTEQWPHPSAMYNGMVAPLTNYGLRGIVWYQGEADAYQGVRYKELLTALIKDWRARWKQKEMPVIVAEIASYGQHPRETGISQWAEVRQSQISVGNALRNVAVVPTYDLGGTTEPHYLRKHEAAERLVDGARAVAYGETSVVYHGPRYKAGSMHIAGDRVQVRFDTTTGGLMQRGAAIKGFEIAGADRKFAWADAALMSRDTVELRTDAVKRPVAVRFGWANHPWATLYNSEGFPAETFRTDNWPTNTQGKL